MDIIEVGKSELAGRTFGKMQTLERGAGLQAIGFMNDVQNRTGYRLTPNEGRRSREDQRLVWNAYALFLAGRGPWAPVAATCYTSRHDEINHGNAIDFGGPGGAVIPANVHAVMVEIGPAYGVAWTGRNFNEWWHFEISRAAATIKVPEGTVRTGSAFAKPTPIKEDDVASVYIGNHNGDIFVYDVGRRTKWNVIKGLKSVEQARQRIEMFKNRGIPDVGAVSGVEVAAFRDITNNNSSDGL